MDDLRIVVRKKATMPRIPLDVCSLSLGAPKDRSYDIIATKQSEKKGDFGVEVDMKVLKEEVAPKVDDVTLVEGVFDGAFSGDGEEDVVMGKGVVVTFSSLKMLTKSYLDDQYDSNGDDWFDLSTVDGKIKVLRLFEMIEHDGRACIYGAFVSVDTDDIFTNDEFSILDFERKIISKDNGKI
uniref:Uncharacterized protein n=1 Tax=Tanacetum cinerariifolium TaxID=118510 RepID=A0A699H0M6_TANCI|nr:hypothetical protein [Tanacetum cinerariifolium]